MKKKTIAAFLCSILICGMIIHTSANSSKFADLDGDGEVTAADLTLLARYVAKVEPMSEEKSWLTFVEAGNIKETYAKYDYEYSSYYGATLLHRVSYTFCAGHVQYESASYSKEDYFDTGETFIYNGETYYYAGAEGCWMMYDVGEDYILVYDDAGNEYHLILNGDELCVIDSWGDLLVLGEVFQKE